MKVISTEVGIEIAVTRVARTESRNTRITRTAKIRPSRPSSVSASIDSWMNGAWSKTTVKVAPATAASRSGRIARTASDTSTVLAAGTLVTEMVRAGWPSTREMLATGFSTSATFATSPMVVRPEPGTGARIGSAAMSSARLSFEPVCTERVVSSSVSEPAGISDPFCCSALRMS